MKMRSGLIVALGLSLATSAVSAQDRVTPASVVGSWRLVALEDRSDQGESRFPFGTNPRGLLIHDTTGHMSIQVMKMPHPKVASGDDEKVTPEEKIALFDACTAYFGTYRVDAARGEGKLWQGVRVFERLK
jgi:lipocalin-like protein